MKITIIYAVLAALLSFSASAETVKKKNIKSIEEEGFSGVGEILRQMSPKQKKSVMAEANKMMPELKKMSKQEIDDLTDKLLRMDSSLDLKQIQVKSLNPSKSKGLNTLEKDIDTYLNK